jgi:2-polyprenyl-3-methyl-5-hydroxy-6-metoxy-1,4-benzoquinol methylase
MLRWLNKLAGWRHRRAPSLTPSELVDRLVIPPPDPPVDSLTDAKLQARLGDYRWYHRIAITKQTATPSWGEVEQAHPPVLRLMNKIDFRGKRVVDVGCRDGLFSFQAERLGAAEVLGIDTSLSLGATELLIPFFKSRVQMREMSLFDLRTDQHGVFDVVLFPGVLYHLRYPFSALKTLSDLLPDGGRMIVETIIFADADKRALLFCPLKKDHPWKRSSITFFNRKGLIDSLTSFGLRTDETDWINDYDRQCHTETFVRGSFLCTKDNALAADFPHYRWSGGFHKTWQKSRDSSPTPKIRSRRWWTPINWFPRC